MSAPRLAFVDWMKAIGMFLIVFGHVAGGGANLVTPPIYPKQLGVAFFLFVTAFTLARETRPAWLVVVSRLFEIVLIGGACAVLATLASLAGGGRGQLSNYLPFLLGANVVIDAFPANPTTWFIGTYIHVILLWALAARHLRPTPGLIAGSLVAEIVIRAALWRSAGPYVAYMTVPNWLTVILLGLYAGGRREPAGWPAWTTAAAAAIAALPLAAGLVWRFDDGFPFRALPAAGAWSLVVASVGVSLIYAGTTWLAYRLTASFRRAGVVEFLAAQTLVIFVVHMPLYYWLLPAIRGWPFALRAATLLSICYVGLAMVGAWVQQWLRPRALRDRVIAAISARLPAAA